MKVTFDDFINYYHIYRAALGNTKTKKKSALLLKLINFLLYLSAFKVEFWGGNCVLENTAKPIKIMFILCDVNLGAARLGMVCRTCDMRIDAFLLVRNKRAVPDYYLIELGAVYKICQSKMGVQNHCSGGLCKKSWIQKNR